MPDSVLIVMPAKPGVLIVESGSSRSVTSVLRAFACPSMLPFWWTMWPCCQPSRVPSQPNSRRPAVADSGWWRMVSELISFSSERHCGGSKLAAMRSRQGVLRSHARSTT